MSVQCYFDDEAFADQAKKAVDLVWPLAVHHLRAPAQPERGPIWLHVYRDSATYAKAGVRAKTDVFRKFPGFADPTTMAGHVLLGSLGNPGWSTVARDGLVHEAMHLAVFAAVPCSSAWHPEWFTEGMAQWAEGEVARLGGWVESRSVDPSEGAAVLAARRQLEAGELPSAMGMLRGDFGTLEKKDRYPATHVLFVMLMERHPRAMVEVFEAARTAPSSPAFSARLRDALEHGLGEAAYQGLDAELVDFVQAREVTAGMPELTPFDGVGRPGEEGYVPTTPGVRFLSDNNKASFTVTARLTVRHAAANQADVVFERSGGKWLRVTWVAGAGVYVTERLVQNGQPEGWRVLASAPEFDGVKLGVPCKLRVQAWSRKLRVSVDGVTVVEAPFEKPDLRGRWGVGAPVGAQVSWRSVGLH